jgi:protein-S-isoprenylcysteine O-methyltransferase Ste14
LGLRCRAILGPSGRVFLQYVSDAQKFFTPKVRKGLIIDGLFGRTRNPTYLGEVLIYAGFVIVSWHWQVALMLAGWFLYYLRNMRRRDKSLSRYPEFAAYKRHTGMRLPAPNSTPVSALRT